MFNESCNLPYNNSPRQLQDDQDEVDFSKWIVDDLCCEVNDLFPEEKVGLNDSKNAEINTLVNSFFCDSPNPSKTNDNKTNLVSNLQSLPTTHLCDPQTTSNFFTVSEDLQFDQITQKLYKTLKLTLKIMVDIGSGFNRLSLDECDFDLHLLKFTLMGTNRTPLESEDVIYRTMKTTVLSYEKVEFTFEGIDLKHIECPHSNKPFYCFQFRITPWGIAEAYKAETDMFQVFSKKPKGCNVHRN